MLNERLQVVGKYEQKCVGNIEWMERTMNDGLDFFSSNLKGEVCFCHDLDIVSYM